MRIAQERTPAGCLFALAGGWLILSLMMQKDLMLDYVAVGLMAAVAIFLFVYRKIYPDSFLVTDALPQPGEMFRGKIETPLMSEPPSECIVHFEITRRRGRYGRTIWRSDHVAHPIRSEHGMILPVEFLIPAEVQKDLDQYCSWRITGSANVRPIPFRAAFLIADSSRNPKASA